MNNEIPFFLSAYVDALHRDLMSSQNYEKYLLDSFPYESKYAKGSTGVFLDTSIKLNADNSDYENSIILYEALKNLSEAQASDERLWVYLSHVHFWEYMRKRWAAEKADEPINRIKDRYFMRTLNLRSLTRNGISRLWWYAHICYNPQNKADHYEYLKILLSRQDLVVGITERALGTNKNIFTGILEFLKQHPQIAKSEEKSRKLLVGLNLAGGVKILPLYNPNEIFAILNTVKNNHFI